MTDGTKLPPIVGYMAAVEGADTMRSAPRQRKPTLASALREAKKVGASIAGATLAADGSVSLTFGEAAKTNGNELDEWMAKHHADSTKGH